jgi:hypothetical protein
MFMDEQEMVKQAWNEPKSDRPRQSLNIFRRGLLSWRQAAQTNLSGMVEELNPSEKTG